MEYIIKDLSKLETMGFKLSPNDISGPTYYRRDIGVGYDGIDCIVGVNKETGLVAFGTPSAHTNCSTCTWVNIDHQIKMNPIAKELSEANMLFEKDEKDY